MPKKSKKNSKKSNNNSLLLAVAISLLLAFPLGYILGTSAENDTSTSETTMSEENMANHSHDGMTNNDSHDHMHSSFEIPEGSPVPKVNNFTVKKDAKSGWNISFETINFSFAPEKASSENIVGEGHAHLYIDEEKITRLYSNNYYLGDLEEGEHTIKITLNTNDHKDYTYNGEVISASQTVTDMHHN